MRCLNTAILAAATAWAQNLESPLLLNGDHLAVNLDPDGVAVQPAFALEPGGALTSVWVNYRHGQERVFAATVRDARTGRNIQLSPGVGVYYRPVMAPTGPGAAWVFWSRLTGGRWQVVGRRKQRDQWGPLDVLSAPEENALKPAAWARGENVVLAWEGDRGREQRVSARVWNGRTWSAPIAVSEEGVWSFRPAVAANTDGSVWVFWDAYANNRYSIFGRPVHPSIGAVERVSDPARDALKVTAATSPASGLAVAWLAREDVIGKGILDQWFTAAVAMKRGGKWIETAAVADLRHSLLAQVEPRVEGLYGYQGRRRDPMLALDGSNLWLLWERRILHAGSGVTAGELCGRMFDGAKWSGPRTLHAGLLDYRVAHAAATRAGKLPVIAKDLHAYYSAFEVDLTQGKPFRFGEWPGWETVKLPLRPDPARPFIELDGRRLSLYWADLHVHSGLTADAEGEVDELMQFARDRARLDAVVIQENDFIRRPLVAGEYALSVYWARRFHDPGRFVAIPGFEWTHRPDDNKPNHRTVMFATDDAPIVRHTENGGNFEELCDMVEAAGGIMNTQHETFRWTKRACEGNIEVASGWRVFIRNPAKIHADLSAGARAGFVATSDGHRRNPGTGGGLTGLWLPELTRAAIVDALRRHRVYATNGARFVVDARANGAFMGDDAVSTDGTVRLTLRVTAPKKIVRAVLIRDGEEVHTVPGAGAALDVTHTDRVPPGQHWYYWRVEQEGDSPDFPANLKAAEGHWAWSSPHRVTVRK